MCHDTGCPIPYGLCHCGCEQRTNLIDRVDRKVGRIVGEPSRYCRGHWRPNVPRYGPVIYDETYTGGIPATGVPIGYCQCGCGQRTTLARQGNRKLGIVLGQPSRYIEGHNCSTPAIGLVYTEEERGYETPCWIWQRAVMKKSGYGMVRYKDAMAYAHRTSYEQSVGPIPEGHELDHLCRVRACIRPDHLEPVTRAVNTRRGRCAKLSPTSAELIRSDTTTPTRILAERYGVCTRTIIHVRKGDTWSATPRKRTKR